MKVRSASLFLAFSVVLAGCAASTSAPSTASGSSGPITIQLKPTVGETVTYLTKMTGPQSMSMTMSMKATKVDPTAIVMEARILDMTVNGAPSPGLDTIKSMVMTLTEDRTGHVTNTDVSGVAPAVASAIKAQGGNSAATYPDHPVNVGDTWEGESGATGKKVKGNVQAGQCQHGRVAEDCDLGSDHRSHQ